MTHKVTRSAAFLLGVVQLLGSAPAQSPAANAPNTVVLTGARLIDGTGAPAIEPAALVIREGRIAAAGPAATVDLPGDAQRIDLGGRTIIPGLINTHAHLNNGDPARSPREQLISQLRLYASYGVTTVQSLGDDGQPAVAVRDEQRSGRLDGARLLVSGPGLTPRTVAEARASIDGHAELGVDIIKTRMEGNDNDMSPAVYRELIDRAHEHGLRVAVHIFYLEDARALVDAGVDIIAHSVRDQDVDAAFISELKDRDVGYMPTLTRDLSVFAYETTPAFFDDPFFLRGVEAFAPNRRQLDQLSNPARQARTRNSPQTRAIKAAIEQAKRNIRLLVEGGATIAMGTDSGTSLGRWQGYFEHVELEMMVESGMTPMQALVSATGDAAHVLRRDQIGTLQPGRQADLVVLRADPLEDIRNTRQIESVWIAGRRIEGDG